MPALEEPCDQIKAIVAGQSDVARIAQRALGRVAAGGAEDNASQQQTGGESCELDEHAGLRIVPAAH